MSGLFEQFMVEAERLYPDDFAKARAVNSGPDCRTCARCYSTKGRGVYGCDSVVGCTNGDCYQQLPPVRLYRSNV